MVVLRNAGDDKAAPLAVLAELMGRTREARLESGVEGGAEATVALRFPFEVPRPGLHAIVLLLEWPVGPAPASGGEPPLASQRAYLLLTLGVAAEPAVRLMVPELSLETMGALPVGLESADGAAHRVAVRVLTPRGLNVLGVSSVEVDVPASGRVDASFSLLRAGAPRESRQGILIVASAADGPLERTAVATGVVKIARDPALLPRLRPALWILAALLLAAAAWAELRRPRAPS